MIGSAATARIALDDEGRLEGVQPAPRRATRDAPDRGALDGVQIAVYTAIADCEAVWRAAGAKCTGYVFQTFEWQAAYQATIGQAEGVLPVIVLVSGRDGEPLLLLPLGIYRQGALRVLRFLGGAVTDYGAPLVAPGFTERFGADFAALWRAILDQMPPFDLVWLRRMPQTVEDEPNPLISLGGATHTRDAYAAHVPATLDAFRTARSAKLFSDGRRQRRRLGEIAALTLEMPMADAAALDTVTAMVRQKSRRYTESGVPDIFARPGYREFYERLTEGPLRLDGVHVSRLCVGDTVVATHWGVLFRNRLYWLMPTYEGGEWQRFSCGRLLLESAFEWCIAHGVKVLDLTVGDERYKLDWADHSLALYEYRLPRSLKGAAYVGFQRARDGLKRNERLRGAAQSLRALVRLKKPQRG